MAAPGAVTLLLVLVAVIPATLAFGCTTCPGDYKLCEGQCWKRLDQAVDVHESRKQCEYQGYNIYGNANWIEPAAPRTAAENDCAIKFAGDQGVWLFYFRRRFEPYGFMKGGISHTPMNYSAWAEGQPDDRNSNEDYVALIPPSVAGYLPGWYDFAKTPKWYTLCVVPYCLN